MYGPLKVVGVGGGSRGPIGRPGAEPDSAAHHMGGPGKRLPMSLGLSLLIYKIEDFNKELNQGMD